LGEDENSVSHSPLKRKEEGKIATTFHARKSRKRKRKLMPKIDITANRT
jgi:hypothetical protein